MTTPASGNDLPPPELLMYWIRERYRILTKKLSGVKAPFSDDPVFQSTYFCNVRREDDKITKWIRKFYSPHVDSPWFEFNIIFSRFLNWPRSLEAMGVYDSYDDPVALTNLLNSWADAGFQVWGNAYVITTHGIKMGKNEYLAQRVLPSAIVAIEKHRAALRGARLAAAAQALQEIEGVGSFLSGQIVADLKNTTGHPLHYAYDYMSFVTPGPGSLRGVSWFFRGRVVPWSKSEFEEGFHEIRKYVDAHWPEEVPRICNQDLQNCLCEFDKYMRVRNGTGRSKRNYNGTAQTGKAKKKESNEST